MWQTASDFIVFIGWLFQNFLIVIVKLFLPVKYIYTFLKEFLTKALSSPPPSPDIFNFDAGVLSIFSRVPYWDTLIFAVIVGVTILMIVFILQSFLNS